MTTAHSTAPLSFADPKAAEEVLRALDAEPHILKACIYDRVGHVFARYARKGIPTSLPGTRAHPASTSTGVGSTFTGGSSSIAKSSARSISTRTCNRFIRAFAA